MDFQKYLIEQMLILVPVLYIVGALIKQTPKVKDWVIPWVLLAVGVVAAIAIGVGSGLSVPDAIIQGILVTGVTVFTNQLVKQTTNKD